MTSSRLRILVPMLFVVLASMPLAGMQRATVTLMVEPGGASLLGQPVVLTATVNAAFGGGHVTFYDGITILGTQPVSTRIGGQASLTTRFLEFGTRSLRAVYSDGAVVVASAAVQHSVDTAAQDSFRPAVSYPTGRRPRVVVTGEFNGDGLPDLAVADGHDGSTAGTSAVAIHVGRGDGRFIDPVSFDMPGGAAGLAVADFDGDGRSDLAVTNDQTGTVTLLHGLPGSFRRGVWWPVGRSPRDIVAGDFNGDGRADLIIRIDRLNYDTELMVLLGQGDGTFQWPVPAPLAVPGAAGRIAVADFNADGRADLAVTNMMATVSVLHGIGDGTFASAVAYPIAAMPYAGALQMTVGDLDGDRRADILVSSSDGQHVSVLRNAGDGTFHPFVAYAVPYAPAQLAVGDVNGDGRLDVAVTNYDTEHVGIMHGGGDGTLAAPIDYALHEEGNSMVVADFNVDGGSDLAIVVDVDESAAAWRGLDVLLGRLTIVTSTRLTTIATTSVLGEAVTLTATVTPLTASGTVSFYDGVFLLGTTALTSRGGETSLTTRSLGFGPHVFKAVYSGDVLHGASASRSVAHSITASAQEGFRPAVLYSTGWLPGEVVTGDFNGDGYPDLAVADRHDGGTTGTSAVGIYVGRRDGTFIDPVSFDVPGGAADLAVADFDGDGRSDLAVTNDVAGTVTLLHGVPGSFRKGVVWPVGRSPRFVRTGDFNADGNADLVVSIDRLNYDRELMVLLGNGDGAFQWPVPAPLAVSGGAGRIAVADFNADGLADLVVTNAMGTVSVLHGIGDGTFTQAVRYPLAATPNVGGVDLTVGDVDGDGLTDVLASTSDGRHVSVLRNRGDGSLQPFAAYAVGYRPRALATGDFNGDGRLDVAVTNYDTEFVGILHGRADGTLAAPVDYRLHGEGLSLAVADFNGDGGSDLAIILDDDPYATFPRRLDILLGRVIVNVTVTASAEGRAFAVDGVTYTSPQTFQWLYGTEHVVETASIQHGSPGTRFVFEGWSDGGALSHVVIGPSHPMTLTAQFRTQYRVTTTASPLTAGTIVVSPASRDSYYDSGTTVQLTASPNRGYTFAGWSGGISGTINPRTVTLRAPLSVIATFTPAFVLR
jgi:hypothetical protein